MCIRDRILTVQPMATTPQISSYENHLMNLTHLMIRQKCNVSDWFTVANLQVIQEYFKKHELNIK